MTFRSVSDNPVVSVRAITLTVNDGTDDSAVATTAVTVTAVNDAPVGGADGPFSTDEDVPLTLNTVDLLANDSDPEGTALTVDSVQGAINGTVALVGSTITFTPDLGYFGPASFSYTVSDAGGATDTVTVSIDVILINDAPVVDLDTVAAGTRLSYQLQRKRCRRRHRQCRCLGLRRRPSEPSIGLSYPDKRPGW